MRWATDVNVRTSCGAGNRRAKGEERNTVAFEKVQQRLAFGTVGMKLNVHRVVMVEAPAIVNRALAEDGNRQLMMKRVGEKALHFPRFAEVPARPTGETNERRSAHQALFGEGKVLRELLIGVLFHQHARDLIVSAAHLPLRLGDFRLRRAESVLVIRDL